MERPAGGSSGESLVGLKFANEILLCSVCCYFLTHLVQKSIFFDSEPPLKQFVSHVLQYKINISCLRVAKNSV